MARFTDEELAEAEVRVDRERKAQGLPECVEDLVALRLFARALSDTPPAEEAEEK